MTATLPQHCIKDSGKEIVRFRDDLESDLFSGVFVGLVVLAGDGLPDIPTVVAVFSLASAATAAVVVSLARRRQARHASHAGLVRPGGRFVT